MRRSTLRFIAFFMFNCSVISLGQTPLFRTYEIKQHGSRLGLQAILFDRNGNLYCGTNLGVMIFDGLNFSPAFNHDSSTAQAVQSLFLDHQQKIWVGYKNGKAGWIHEKQFSWIDSAGGPASSAITDFSEDPDGHLLYSTEGQGIFLAGDSGIINYNTNKGLSDDYCYKLLKLPDGRICVATDQGINFLSIRGNTIKNEIFSSENGLPDNIVRDMVIDNDNNILISLQDKGFCFLNTKSKEISIPPESTGWRYGQINSILRLDKEIWLGTEKHGLVRYQADAYCESINQASFNPRNQGIKFMLRDKERFVWIICGNQLVRSSAEVFSKLPDADPAKPFTFVHCILSDKSGNIWFSPDQQLVCAKKLKKGSYEFTKYPITNPGKLTDIVTLSEDKRGFIWIGTLGEGIFIMNPVSGKIQHPENYHALSTGNVLAIEEFQDKLVIGGFEGIQTYKLQFSENTGLYSFTEERQKSLESLYKSYVYSLYNDNDERLWIGTDEKGLAVLENNELRYYNKTDGLSSNTIVSISSDQNGKLWMASQGGGIISYDNKNFNVISVADGLSDPSPTSVIPDGSGKLVIVHANGIDLYNPKNKGFQYYSSETGLGEINADLKAVSKDPAGRIWIGTEKGVYIYVPPKENEWYQPEVKITDILLFLQPVNWQNSSSFDYDQNNISIEFTAPWYTDPNRISYYYQLDGFSNKWQNTKDRSVSYPKLPPGNYTFRVRASLNNLYADARETSYTFKINSPFWQRTWFRFLLTAVILLIIWMIIRRRETRLKRKEAELKEKIEFRFETLRSQVNPHFLFNSFNTLITVIEQDPNLAVEYVEHLSKFFRDIVGYRDVESITLKEEIALLENYLFIQSKRFGNNLKLDIRVDEALARECLIPPLTLQLLAENAIKHNSISHESALRIEVYVSGNYLKIKNNINPKFTKEKSTGMGLQNIVSRYKILTKIPVEIQSDSENFIVSLPLFKSSDE